MCDWVLNTTLELLLNALDAALDQGIVFEVNSKETGVKLIFLG